MKWILATIIACASLQVFAEPESMDRRPQKILISVDPGSTAPFQDPNRMCAAMEFILAAQPQWTTQCINMIDIGSLVGDSIGESRKKGIFALHFQLRYDRPNYWLRVENWSPLGSADFKTVEWKVNSFDMEIPQEKLGTLVLDHVVAYHTQKPNYLRAVLANAAIGSSTVNVKRRDHKLEFFTKDTDQPVSLMQAYELLTQELNRKNLIQANIELGILFGFQNLDQVQFKHAVRSGTGEATNVVSHLNLKVNEPSNSPAEYQIGISMKNTLTAISNLFSQALAVPSLSEFFQGRSRLHVGYNQDTSIDPFAGQNPPVKTSDLDSQSDRKEIWIAYDVSPDVSLRLSFQKLSGMPGMSNSLFTEGNISRSVGAVVHSFK